jgi:hypothetical protein
MELVQSLVQVSDTPSAGSAEIQFDGSVLTGSAAAAAAAGPSVRSSDCAAFNS